MRSRQKGVSKAVLAVVIVVVVVLVGVAVWQFLLPKGPQFAGRTLTIITWGGPWKEATETYAKKFAEEFGVEVKIELHGGPSSVGLSKLRSAWPNPIFDVMMMTSAVGFQGAVEGFFVELTEENLPVLKEIPDVFEGKLDGKTYWVAMYPYVGTIVYRTDLVPFEIKSFQDLLKPELKGKIAVPYPTYLPGSWLIAASIPKGGDERNLDPGFEFAKQLAESGNIGYVFKSDSDVLRLLETGEAWVGWTLTGNAYTLAKKGVPVKAVLEFEDTKPVAFFDVIAVVDGPNKDVALAFVNWLLQPENLGGFTKMLGYVPSHPEAEVDPEVAKWNIPADQMSEKAYVPDFLYLAENVDKWATKWDTEITPLLG